ATPRQTRLRLEAARRSPGSDRRRRPCVRRASGGGPCSPPSCRDQSCQVPWLSLLYGGSHARDGGLDVSAEVHPEGAALPLGQHLKVAAGLRRLHNAKGVVLSRNRDVDRVAAGDLQEDTAIGPSLVGLSR